MIVIKPIPITEATLVSSTCIETAPAAYTGGTTYALNAYVSVVGLKGEILLYRSLQASNTGHTPSSSPTWWVSAGSTYQTYSAASTYALGDKVLDIVTHQTYESLTSGNTGQDVLNTPRWLVIGSVSQSAPAAYDVATTYALSGLASITGAAGLITVYKSLQAGNINHAPASSPTWWVSTGITYQTYSETITYALGDKVIDTSNKAYESLIAGNLNQSLTAQPRWLALGPSNRFAMFDEQVSSVSSGYQEMTVVIAPGIHDSLALVGANAELAYLTIRDGLTGPIVYESSQGLAGDIPTDWYQYFFSDPLSRRSQAVFLGLPPMLAAYSTVRLTSQGAVNLGALIVGRSSDIGQAQYGASAGIVDYSVKETDTFGKTTFVRRAFKRRLSARLMVESLQLNRIQRLLYDLRATPCLWVATDTPGYDEALMIYAFYKDFTTEITYPTASYCSLELEGLI